MNIEITIAEIIARVESRGFAGAVRFEPATYNQFSGKDLGKVRKEVRDILGRIVTANRCSMATAAMIYSSSWGAYQLMGFNVYADPFTVSIAEYLNSQRLQLESFYGFLKRNGLQDYKPESMAENQTLRLKFAMKYNGSIAYDIPLSEALQYFGFHVKQSADAH